MLIKLNILSNQDRTSPRTIKHRNHQEETFSSKVKEEKAIFETERRQKNERIQRRMLDPSNNVFAQYFQKPSYEANVFNGPRGGIINSPSSYNGYTRKPSTSFNEERSAKKQQNLNYSFVESSSTKPLHVSFVDANRKDLHNSFIIRSNELETSTLSRNYVEPDAMDREQTIYFKDQN